MEPRRFDVEGEQRRHGGFERVAERDGQLAKRRRAAAAGGEQQFIAQNFLTRRVFSLSPLNGERVGVRGLSILKRPPPPPPPPPLLWGGGGGGGFVHSQTSSSPRPSPPFGEEREKIFLSQV